MCNELSALDTKNRKSEVFFRSGVVGPLSFVHKYIPLLTRAHTVFYVYRITPVELSTSHSIPVAVFACETICINLD